MAKSPSLAKAQQLYGESKFKRVLPLLNKALRESPSPREEVQIYELTAFVHVAFNRSQKARAAFFEVLERNPNYDVPANSSPKIRKAFRQAKKRFRKKPQRTVVAAPDPDPEPEPAPEPAPASTADATSKSDFDIPPPEPELTRSADEDGAFYETWWFWTAVGVVAVGAGVGIAVATQPGEPETQFGPFPLP
ncbi:MAG: hypothetical protein AAFU77_11415 [Myxococcota bacterium]